MPDIIQQGTEEGLRLLEQSPQGLDLTAPTPDLPKPEVLPEDRTFLGFSDITSGERAKIKLAREKQNINKLNSMFGISSKVIGQAQTRKKGEEREKFLNTMLPRVERVYPGISKQIRIFADDSERFQELGRQLKNPTNQAVFQALGASGQHDKAIEFASKLSSGSKRGGSEFERLTQEQQEAGDLTEEKVKELKKKRVSVLAGTEMRRGPERSLEHRQAKQKQVFTKRLRKEATEGTEHFSSMEASISDAIAAINSGDIGVSDTLLNQILTGVSESSNIKAMAMFNQFDKSYGNVAERTVRSIDRFFSGTRSDSEKAKIQETLENFRDSHVRPGINKLKTQYRNLAIEEGADPFRVVPPKPGCENAGEIRDYPGITRDEKIRLLKRYYPECFKGGAK